MAEYRSPGPGEPAPWFRQRSSINPSFAFDTVGGRWVLLAFVISGGDEEGAAGAAALEALSDLFDDVRIAAFAVSCDPADETGGRMPTRMPGLRTLWDFDGEAGKRYGAVPSDAAAGAPTEARRVWFLLDPSLRVFWAGPQPRGEAEVAALRARLAALPAPDAHAGAPLHAPVLLVPRVFEPEFCRRLIDHYEAHGGEESGFMRDVGGKTVLVTDPAHKRRRDRTVEDVELLEGARARIRRRLVPELHKAFAFQVTRIERHIVACYEADASGHFRAHRDNTTKGTAHRRFAVSINLNDAFEGGLLSFPEFGSRRYKPPTGAAVVFSCSLLHQVDPVTAGRRFAYLPFLYDEAAAAIREENARFLEEGLTGYRAGGEAGAAAE